MLTLINPASVPSPPSRYSQAVEVAPGARWPHVSGQLGVNSDGVVLDGFEPQMRQAMANLMAVLREANMGVGDIVKLTVLAIANDPATVASYRNVRDELLGEHAPAALFAAVSGFTQPEFLVEIEAVAACAP